MDEAVPNSLQEAEPDVSGEAGKDCMGLKYHADAIMSAVDSMKRAVYRHSLQSLVEEPRSEIDSGCRPGEAPAPNSVPDRNGKALFGILRVNSMCLVPIMRFRIAQ